MGDQRGVSIGSKKGAGKKLAKRRRISPPAFADQGHHGLIFFRIVTGPGRGTPAIRAIEDEAADTFGVFVRVCGGGPAAFRNSKQDRILRSDLGEYGIQVE